MQVHFLNYLRQVHVSRSWVQGQGHGNKNSYGLCGLPLTRKECWPFAYSQQQLIAALEVFLNDMPYINSRFTYLLTFAIRIIVIGLSALGFRRTSNA